MKKLAFLMLYSHLLEVLDDGSIFSSIARSEKKNGGFVCKHRQIGQKHKTLFYKYFQINFIRAT